MNDVTRTLDALATGQPTAPALQRPGRARLQAPRTTALGGLLPKSIRRPPSDRIVVSTPEAACLHPLGRADGLALPHKGAAPALTDLVGGHVQLFFSPPLSLISHIKSSRIKCIAITGEARSPTLPQVPTFAEAGLTGFEVRIWYGVLAPPGTPRATTEKVSNELARILAAPDTKERMNAQGVEPRYAGSSDFVATMKADHARFAGVIRTAGIKLEQ